MRLIIYCTDNSSREIVELAHRANTGQWSDVCVVGEEGAAKDLEGLAVKKSEEFWLEPVADGTHAVIAATTPAVRSEYYARLQDRRIALATIIDPTAVVSETAKVKAGSIVFPATFISSGACVEENCIVGSGAIVGHDAKVGQNCYLASQANIGGHCIIGQGVVIGPGAQIRNDITIGEEAFIEMGSVVYRAVDPRTHNAGNPSRRVKL